MTQMPVSSRAVSGTVTFHFKLYGSAFDQIEVLRFSDRTNFCCLDYSC